MATKHPLDGTEPSSNAGGRPPALKPEHIAILHDFVTERAQASLQEIADELYHRCGLRVYDATIRRALRAQGIVRLKPVRRTCTERAEGAKRYGYTAAHRRKDISPRTAVINTYDVLCDQARCHSEIDGVPLYKHDDRGHPSAGGSRIFYQLYTRKHPGQLDWIFKPE